MIWIVAILFLPPAYCTDSFQVPESGAKGDFKAMREKMVETQIKARGVKDSRVLSAMMKVERHCFVPKNLQTSAYSDQPLPIGE